MKVYSLRRWLAPAGLALSMLLFPLAPLWAQASAPVLEMGPDYSHKSTIGSPRVVGFDGTHYYTVEARFTMWNNMFPRTIHQQSYLRERLKIRKFDRDLHMIHNRELTPQTQKEKEKVFGLIYSQHRIFVFSIYNNRKARHTHLHVREVDSTTLDWKEAEGTSLVVVDYNKFPGLQETLDVTLTLSRDSSKILISYTYPSKSKQAQIYGLALFNEEMIPLWHKTITLPYPKQKLNVWEFQVNHEGKVFLLAKYSPNASRLRLPKHIFKIFAIPPGDTLATEKDVPAENWILQDLQMTLTRDGNLTCIGSCWDTTFGKLEGLIFLTLSQDDMAVLTESYHPFGKAILDEVSSGFVNATGESRKDFRKFVFNDVMPRTDGGMVIIGEAKSTGRTPKGSLAFGAFGLLIININPSGQFVNVRRIPKSQLEPEGFPRISYALGTSNENLHLFYNDWELNAEPAKDKKPFIPSRYYIRVSDQHAFLVYSIVAGMPPERFDLANLGEISKYAITASAKQINRNELVLVFRHNDTACLGRIRFE